MNPDLVSVLEEIPPGVAIQYFGWNTFLEYRVICYLETSKTFQTKHRLHDWLGMDPQEYADWVLTGHIADSTKRLWRQNPADTTEEA